MSCEQGYSSQENVVKTVSDDVFSSNKKWCTITKYCSESGTYVLNPMLFKNMNDDDMRKIIPFLEIKTNNYKTGGWDISERNKIKYIFWDIFRCSYRFIVTHKTIYNTKINKSYGINHINMLSINYNELQKYKNSKE